ncbi:MAG TPA: 4-alpha-glucanotransferase [Stenomitos sp.]
MLKRSSGILLHPTSLPGPFGIGDLGPEAYAFIDRLAAMKQSCWQVLPLTPTSYGDSPYFSPSAFAGNPLLLSPERLIEEHWITSEDLRALPASDPERIDYAAVAAFKTAMLDRVAERFEERAPAERREALAAFTTEHAGWLADYALFMALKDEQGGRPWIEWPSSLTRRAPEALAEARARLSRPIRRHELAQFLFFQQWQALKAHAAHHGIGLIGDAPIFVAHDSADVWAHPELWRLDDTGHPLVVAGVPPDYFSATGQLWGNPLYRWDRMAETGYRWWVDRLRTLLKLVDRVRLDHFRGFAAFWEIPAGEPTAVNGRWVPGPGKPFFAALQEQLGTLPIIAEDLGVITPDVVDLRDTFGLPGMKILQFAFDTSEENNYFPHLFPHNAVVYTGTHDNDTSMGWYRKAKESDRALLAEYVGKTTLEEPNWELVRLGHASVADLAIVPMQDLMGLGSEARMNLPGTLGGNWQWRYRADQLTGAIMRRFGRLTELYDRDLR